MYGIAFLSYRDVKQGESVSISGLFSDLTECLTYYNKVNERLNKSLDINEASLAVVKFVGIDGNNIINEIICYNCNYLNKILVEITLNPLNDNKEVI